MGKKDAKKKAKGPKGKKARAKAKLDRAWGEVPTLEDPRSDVRRGKSRIIKKEFNHKKESEEVPDSSFFPAPEPEFSKVAVTDGDDDDDDSSRDDASDYETAPVNNLLQSISRVNKKKRKAHKVKQLEKLDVHREDSSVDMEDAEDDRVEVDDGSGSESSEGSDNDEVADDDSIGDDMQDSKVDHFRDYFGRSSMSKHEIEQSVPSLKVTLDSSHDIVIAAPQGSEILYVAEGLQKVSPLDEEWQQRCEDSFSANRKVLQRRWKKRKDGSRFSPIQSQIYPFLSQHMDMLVTATSAKVGTNFKDDIEFLRIKLSFSHYLCTYDRSDRVWINFSSFIF